MMAENKTKLVALKKRQKMGVICNYNKTHVLIIKNRF